jgi:hypothetical protein
MDSATLDVHQFESLMWEDDQGLKAAPPVGVVIVTARSDGAPTDARLSTTHDGPIRIDDFFPERARLLISMAKARLKARENSHGAS